MSKQTYSSPTGDFVTSSLIGPITSGSTSATIGSSLTLPAANGILQIDYDSIFSLGVDGGPETVSYTSYNSSTGAITGVSRGLAGTTAVAHSNTATVQCAPSSLYVSQQFSGFAVGNFQSHATTGAKPITGLGFTPRGVRFRWISNTTGTNAATLLHEIGSGSADGTNQNAQYSAINLGFVSNSSTEWSTSLCIMAKQRDGGNVYTAAFTSLDADGFTITVSNADNSYMVFWEAVA